MNGAVVEGVPHGVNAIGFLPRHAEPGTVSSEIAQGFPVLGISKANRGVALSCQGGKAGSGTVYDCSAKEAEMTGKRRHRKANKGRQGETTVKAQAPLTLMVPWQHHVRESASGVLNGGHVLIPCVFIAKAKGVVQEGIILANKTPQAVPLHMETAQRNHSAA